MLHISVYAFFLICLHCFVTNSLCQDLENMIDSIVLNVGEELWEETLPLQMGSRLYELQGLKPSKWYEVKISYPASVPASFSLQLRRGKSNIENNWNRRLLNTEKLIFRVDDDYLNASKGKILVLVNVEPEGVVAIPHVQDREYIIFNIVCDELAFGIPHKAWWVVSFVVLCLGLAFIVPYFLQSHLLQENQSLHMEILSSCGDQVDRLTLNFQGLRMIWGIDSLVLSRAVKEYWLVLNNQCWSQPPCPKYDYQYKGPWAELNNCVPWILRWGELEAEL